ncbi:MAG: xylulokinase [Ilumatobacteraceae bacterium]
MVHRPDGSAVVAGVDSSTQSTKVEIRRVDDGSLVGSGRAPHPATTPPVSEQDPESWWAAFESAWAEATASGCEPSAVSIGGQQHGMVVLDSERHVVRPAKLWNDTESAPDAAWLVKNVPGGASALAAATGSVPVAAFTVTKLSWLHRSEPEAWKRLAHVLLPHDWLTMKLTGDLTTDRGDASGTGYFDPSANRYVDSVLETVDAERDWSNVLPRVLGPTEVAGEWQGLVVGPGTGDNMAAALGMALAPGDVAMSIGTSGTVYACTDLPARDESGAVAGFADATGRFLPLVCTLNGAKVLDAARRLLGVDHETFDEMALSVGSGGLTLLPYLDGERTPDRPNATGMLAGLRSDVSREQFAAAVVDGVVCGMIDALGALVAQVPVTGRLLLTGGAARSRAVREVVAAMVGSAHGLEVVHHEADEAVATGAAVQAAAVLTGEEPLAVAERWGLGRGAVVPPADGHDSVGVIERYAELRDLGR